MPLSWFFVTKFIQIMYIFYLTQKKKKKKNRKKNPFRCLIKYFESASPELGLSGDGKRTIF